MIRTRIIQSSRSRGGKKSVFKDCIKYPEKYCRTIEDAILKYFESFWNSIYFSSRTIPGYDVAVSAIGYSYFDADDQACGYQHDNIKPSFTTKVQVWSLE